MSWYQEAKHIIDDAIKNCKDGDFKKAIDNAYPFGERRYFPYKAWLKARKEKFISLGLCKVSLTKQQKEREIELSNSKGLFDAI